MSEEVNKRNIHTLAEYIKKLDRELVIAVDKIKHLEGIVAQLSGKVQMQDQTITILRIKNMGTGPTA